MTMENTVIDEQVCLDSKVISDFLFHEADLLDNQEFQAWGNLFAKDGIYWIPASHGQEDPLNQVSHVYEDALLRDVRILRFGDANAHSLQPMPSSSHLLSNIRIENWDSTVGDVVVRSRFVMAQFHRDEVTQFFGEYVHTLSVQDQQNITIKMKRVNLVNCEGMIGDIVLYI